MVPEYQLLIQCLRPKAPGDAVVPEQDCDWPRFVALARRHEVVPQVHRACRQGGLAMPATDLTTLKRHFYSIGGWNAFVVSELVRLIRLFREAGIQMIPYKGPLLSSLLMGKPSARESKDLDLVVHRSDLMAARDLLIANGYAREDELTPTEEEFLLRSRKESSYDFRLPFEGGEGTRLKIELHWRIAMTARVPEEWYWDHVVVQEFEGEETWVFQREALLLILLCHGFRHYWESLKWLSDIDLLIRSSPDFSWERYNRLADELGLRRVGLFGLMLTREMLDTRLPPSFDALLAQEPLVSRLLTGARLNLEGQQRCPVGMWNNLLIRERIRDRLFYLRNVLDYVFQPALSDLRRYPLPRPFWPLYVLLRPLKAVECTIRKYGRVIGGGMLFGRTKR